MRIDAPSITGSFTLGATTLPDGNALATTGSNTFTGNQTINGTQTINGNLIVTGSLTAQQYIISSSVTYLTESFASGSNKFGDTSDDYHDFTGSLRLSGSLNINSGSIYTTGAYIGLSRTAPEFLLDVNGDIALNRTNKIMFAGPTAGDRSRSYFIGDGNNNIFVYGPSSNVIATFNYTGNFLVGTTGDTGNGTKLQVSGSLETSGVVLGTSAALGIHKGQLYTDSSNALNIYAYDAGGIIFRALGGGTSPTEQMRIHTNGYIGMGTASPAVMLDIQEVATNGPKLTVTITGSWGGGVNQDHGIVVAGARYGANDTNTSLLHLKNIDNTSLFRVTDYGKVGIGTSSPYKQLTVANAVGGTVVGESEILRLAGTEQAVGDKNEIGFATYATNYHADVVLGRVLTSTAGYCQSDFYIATRGVTTDTAATERFRVTNFGSVGIGTTSPTNFGAGYNGLSIDGSSYGGVLDLMVGGVRSLTLAVDSSTPQIAAKISGQDIKIMTNGGSGSAERMRVLSNGGFNLSYTEIGNISSAPLSSFNGAGYNRYHFTCPTDNTIRTLVSSINQRHLIIKIAGTDAGTFNYGEYYFTMSFPGYGVASSGTIYHQTGGWNTGDFTLSFTNTSNDYYLQFKCSSYYSTTATASYYMEVFQY
jgi:hypothetical protein